MVEIRIVLITVCEMRSAPAHGYQCNRMPCSLSVREGGSMIRGGNAQQGDVARQQVGIPLPRRGVVGLACFAGVLMWAVAGCGDNSSGSGTEKAPLVVATTGIWADVVANIACEGGIELETVIPPGGDPHRFEPSLADRKLMDTASLVVANGLTLEEGLLDTLEAVEESDIPVYYIGEHLEPVSDEPGEHDEDAHDEDGHDEDAHDEDAHDEDAHDEDGHDEDAHDEDSHDEDGHAAASEHRHDHQGLDPHVWLDPVRVSVGLTELGEQLVLHVGSDPVVVEQCVDRYRNELDALHEEIEEMVSSVPEQQRALVTGHDALGYFAERYGFETVGTVIPSVSGLAETNPAHLEEVAVMLEEKGIRAIFSDAGASDDDVRALANRVGNVNVVPLSLGTLGATTGDDDTYIDLMRTIASLITGALR